MNLDALAYLVTHAPEQITEQARGNLVCTETALDIARHLLSSAGDLQRLSPGQQEVYAKGIRPLIENVCCEGLYGDGSCVHDGLIDAPSLKACYTDAEFLCGHCRSVRRRREEEDARACRNW